MITIISASNREGNLTAIFARVCFRLLQQKNQKVELFALDEIPEKVSLKSVYDYNNSYFSKRAKEVILPAQKLLFVVPEYNGSIPGILKLVIDAIEPSYFKNKKAALIGVASGRAGNLRGMDHLSDILNHLEVNVMPQKLPISKMNDLLGQNELTDITTEDLLEQQVERLINF